MQTILAIQVFCFLSSIIQYTCFFALLNGGEKKLMKPSHSTNNLFQTTPPHKGLFTGHSFELWRNLIFCIVELLAPRVFFDFVGVIDLSLSWWCTILCWMVQEKASPSLKSSRNPHGTYCPMPKLLISWRLRFELLTVQNPWEPGTSGIAILQALGRLVLETLTWRLRQRIWTLIFHN